MAKNKSDQLPHYELMYLLSNQFSEQELPALQERVEKIISDHGGTITSRQNLGKKRLAYKIKQFRHGYYFVVEFDAPTTAAPQINQQLKLMSEVLRHQIIKTEAKSAEELARQAAILKKLAEPLVAAPLKEATVKPAAVDKRDENKIELADLDDKLDKILESENLI